MFCSKCGTQNAEGAGYCTKCGVQLNSASPISTPAPVYTPVSPPPPYPTTERRTSGLAIASLILGILGISLLAIIFGAIALNQMGKDPNLSGKGMAIAGLILGIVWIVVSVVLALLLIGVAVSST